MRQHVETNGCPIVAVLLLEVDTVGARVWVFVSFEIVQGHPKLSKDCITQVLELACMDTSSVSHRLASISQLSLAAQLFMPLRSATLMLAVPHCTMPSWVWVVMNLVDCNIEFTHCIGPAAATVLPMLHARHETQSYKNALHLAFHPSSSLVSLLQWVVVVQ